MFSFVPIHDPLLTCSLLDHRKENLPFAVMVTSGLFVPGKTVVEEIWDVRWNNPWGLQLDAIVAADNDIVDQGHV